MSSYAARTREMFRKYGKVAVGVHFAVYFTGLGACYVAVERGVKVDKLLRGWGLMGEKKEKVKEGGGGTAAAAAAAAGKVPREAAGAAAATGAAPGAAPGAAGAAAAASTSSRQQLEHEEEDDDGRNWIARALSGHGSSLALAFVANKALFPVRAPITLGLTPAVAKALRVNAARSAAAASSSASASGGAGRSSGNGVGGSGSGGGGSGSNGGGAGSAQ